MTNLEKLHLQGKAKKPLLFIKDLIIFMAFMFILMNTCYMLKTLRSINDKVEYNTQAQANYNECMTSLELEITGR